MLRGIFPEQQALIPGLGLTFQYRNKSPKTILFSFLELCQDNNHRSADFFLFSGYYEFI
jgi:hypothetical protein